MSGDSHTSGPQADSASAPRDASGDELISSQLYLVQHIVNEVAARFPRHVDRGELWNAGALGLVEAAHRYDPTSGTPFGRFAAIRIRGAILDSTRSRDWASRGMRRKARALAGVEDELQRRHGRPPSDAEVGDELGVGADEVQARQAATRAASLLHLDQPLGDAESEPWTLGELLEELTDALLPEEALVQRELIGTLRAAVSHLPDRLREVLQRYYYHGEYLRDIAESLGVTEARASQLRGEAIASLRAYFAEHFDSHQLAGHAAAPGARRRSAYVAEFASATTWRSRLEAAGTPPASLASTD